MTKVYIDDAGIKRCAWVATTEEFVQYHDQEWGFPVKDNIRLFEKLCLESFQSGLSWRTILAKRESFRLAFSGFDFHKIAEFNELDVKRLLNDEGIVRHKGKIEATINNAKCAIEMEQQHGSLAKFFWQFEDARPLLEQRSQSELSQQCSKQLKKLGWKFVGPTTVYSFMQAAGMVNDHSPECHCYEKVAKLRKDFSV